MVDLNKIPGANQPATIFREREFDINCCCVDGGYVTLKLTLPHSCFTPGESIPITADIENHSDRTLKGTSAALLMNVVYRERNGKSINTNELLLVISSIEVKFPNTRYVHI